MSTLFLSQLKQGEKGSIVGIQVNKTIRRRLQDVGFIEGTEVECVGSSPLGDPRAYLVRGAVIALRSAEGNNILVDRQE